MQMVEGFVANMTMRGLSPATIKRRRWTLTTFVDWIAPRTPCTATTFDVETFLASRAAPATRRALLSDLRAFYRWGCSRGLLNIDPTAPIETPRVPKRLPTPLTRNELRLAWRAADVEMRMILALGSSAGLRVSEIAALHGIDIDCTNRILTVRNGKGGKDRRVPMTQRLVEMFQHAPDGPIFRCTTGEGISAKVRAHFRRIGICRRPHDLRATFCTEVARVSGGNMLLVAALAGHESVQTSERYVAFDQSGFEVIDALYGAAA